MRDTDAVLDLGSGSGRVCYIAGSWSGSELLGLAIDVVSDPEIKARAKARSEEAISRDVVGSPWFFVDDEPFWGWDRLPMIDDWLTRGGW